MKRHTFLIALVLVLVAVLVIPAGSALAQTVIYDGFLDIIIKDVEVKEGSVEITGGELVVEAGGLIEGDVNVFGGNATIAGNINGNLVVFGGSVILSGEVDGDLVTFGGNLDVTSDGYVDGDCVVLGGNITDDSNRISCASFAEGFPFRELPFLDGMTPGRVAPPVERGPGDFPLPTIETPSFMNRLGSILLGVGGAFGRSLIAAFVAFLIAALMPEQLQRTSNVVRDKPVASGLVGVLSIVTAPALLVLLLILSAVLILACGLGLLGFPVAIVMAIGMVAAGVFGWVAMGN